MSIVALLWLMIGCQTVCHNTKYPKTSDAFWYAGMFLFGILHITNYESRYPVLFCVVGSIFILYSMRGFLECLPKENETKELGEKLPYL